MDTAMFWLGCRQVPANRCGPHRGKAVRSRRHGFNEFLRSAATGYGRDAYRSLRLADVPYVAPNTGQANHSSSAMEELDNNAGSTTSIGKSRGRTVIGHFAAPQTRGSTSCDDLT